MMWVEKDITHPRKKFNMLQHFFQFDGFIIGYNIILEVHEYINNGYWLESEKSGEYDPKWYIKRIKARYTYHLNLEDVAIRNYDDLTEAY